MNNIRRILYLTMVTSKYKSPNINSIIPGAPTIANRYIFTKEIKATLPKVENESFISKLRSKISLIVSKNRLKVTGYILYESIVDNINYGEMFQKLNLPDTFYSWFIITELHVWMLMVRFMAEGEAGRCVRNTVVEALWSDANARAKKLVAANPRGVRMQISELSEQLHAALIAYDEGLQSTDVVLAGALWRRFYQQKSVDPEHLDVLVKYIRKQVKTLDNMTHRELFEERKLKWKLLKM